MTPIQQMMLGLGGVIKTKYVDEIFSTYLWKGDGSTGRTITNNVKTDEGTLTWIKNRSSTSQNVLTDTVRGANETLYSDSTNGNYTHSSLLTAFTATGFTVGSDAYVNGSGDDYSSWTFKKKEGFCDIVTYTGDGASSKTISHSLGSIPGLIIIKCTSHSGPDWVVWHRDFGSTDFLKLNETSAKATDNEKFGGSGSVAPTATTFTVGLSNDVNGSSRTYVAYVFAGGKSTAATAASCSFNGTSGLNIAASSDINFGTGTFCVEGWVYIDNLPGGGYGRFFQLDGPSGNNDIKNLQVTLRPSDATLHAWSFDGNVNVSISGSITMLQGWHHIAVVRDSNNLITQYVDGVADGTATNITTDFSPNSGSPRPAIGHYPVDPTGGFTFDGKISNLRVTVGEPVYTTNFTPLAEPLTTSNSQVTSSSNVKLLCCNSSSSATASTVTPGTISNNGTNPTAYGNNPFDDPAGFKFGENEDQQVIKCGTIHLPSGETNVGEYLGFEPQWYLYKRSDGTGDWNVFDSMRGWLVNKPGGGTYVVGEGLSPNNTNAEANYYQTTSPTSTGVHLDGVGSGGKDYIYMAIRRPDGYVGKPADAGTGVFTMDVAGSTSPAFDSGFPVDFALVKNPSTTDSWDVAARLLQKRNLKITTAAEGAYSSNMFDYQSSWLDNTSYNGIQSWMWKRGQGMDVVGWEGTNSSVSRRHNLGRTPEMIWFKNRTSSTRNWRVYHKGLNGGTNPEDYDVSLNSNSAEASNTNYMTSTAPTSTHFVAGNDDDTNGAGSTYIALLFASVEGISKVGYFDGSNSEQTITTGFQPRFLIVKATSTSGHWNVLDTTRGWAAGNDPYLKLNATSAQNSSYENGAPTSTGFTLAGNNGGFNVSGVKYLYYAHA